MPLSLKTLTFVHVHVSAHIRHFWAQSLTLWLLLLSYGTASVVWAGCKEVDLVG